MQRGVHQNLVLYQSRAPKIECRCLCYTELQNRFLVLEGLDIEVQLKLGDEKLTNDILNDKIKNQKTFISFALDKM